MLTLPTELPCRVRAMLNPWMMLGYQTAYTVEQKQTSFDNISLISIFFFTCQQYCCSNGFLVWFDASPGKQFFSHVGTEPPLNSLIPGYYQYFLGVNNIMSCSRTQHSDPSGGCSNGRLFQCQYPQHIFIFSENKISSVMRKPAFA